MQNSGNTGQMPITWDLQNNGAAGGSTPPRDAGGVMPDDHSPEVVGSLELLRPLMENAKSKATEYEQKSDEIHEESLKLQGSLSEKKTKVVTVSSKLSLNQRKYDREKSLAASLYTGIGTLERRKNEEEAQITEAGADIEKKRIEISFIDKEIYDKKEELEKRQASVTELESQISEGRAELLSLQNDIVKEETKHEKLKRESERATGKYTAYSEQHSDLCKLMKRLERKRTEDPDNPSKRSNSNSDPPAKRTRCDSGMH
jgi:chromosome segregation ATPase